jgi:hypothetical protein
MNGPVHALAVRVVPAVAGYTASNALAVTQREHGTTAHRHLDNIVVIVALSRDRSRRGNSRDMRPATLCELLAACEFCITAAR